MNNVLVAHHSWHLFPWQSLQSTMSEFGMNGVFLEQPGLLREALKREKALREGVGSEIDAKMGTAAVTRSTAGMTGTGTATGTATATATAATATATATPAATATATATATKTAETTSSEIPMVRSLKALEAERIFFPKPEPDDSKLDEPQLNETEESNSVPSFVKAPRLDYNDVVIVRHGQTEFNKLKIFTGWLDASLAPEGRAEARAAGLALRENGIKFDLVYTSWLSRAIETAWCILDAQDALWVPILKSWRLNERQYGSLQGLSKRMVNQRHGEEKFLAWRRGFETRPPKTSSFDKNYPGNDERYQKYLGNDVRISLSESIIRSIEAKNIVIHRKLPKTESLKDCMDRTIPFFTEHIVPDSIAKGKRVLIASSENAIRGLLMHLCEIPEDKISQLEIPTGLPLVFSFRSRCISLLPGYDVAEYNFGTIDELLFRPCLITDDDDGGVMVEN